MSLLSQMILNHGPLMNECQRREIWPKWKDAIEVKMDSLMKRKVFKLVMPTLSNEDPLVNRFYVRSCWHLLLENLPLR